eukprot:scaffold3103_cov136-Cylindrotheca_fusiformis.AAC.31
MAPAEKSSPSCALNRDDEDDGKALISNDPIKDKQPSSRSLQPFFFRREQSSIHEASDSSESCLSSPMQSRSYLLLGRRSFDYQADKRDFDRDLASTMAKLSVKDREIALEEVNGIANCVEEDADAMETALRKLEELLNDIKAGTAYEEAEMIDLSLVSDRASRVMFLRGNRYNPEITAKQMIAFFDSKRMLFGKELLAKHITLNDLDEDDRDAIREGSIQVLPQRDRSGRQILFEFRGLERFKSPHSEMRTKYYMLMSMLESEETQKKGILVIFYSLGEFRDKENRPGIVELAKMVQTLPLHLAGFHFCCDDYKQYLMMWPVLGVTSTERVARFRHHLGSPMECEYSLRSLGILEGSIPISPRTGEVLKDNHILWYRDRQMREAEGDWDSGKPPNRAGTSARSDGDIISIRDVSAKQPIVPDLGSPSGSVELALRTPIIARPCDIIFGLNHKSHPGTVWLHEVITRNEAKLTTIMDRRQKVELLALLVRRIKSTGSRFLVYDKGTRQLKEVDETLARNKISKIVRNRQRIR